MSHWTGTRPEKCDLCGRDLRDQFFVDGKTRFGPWAIMCLSCHSDQQLGVGTGRGQIYNEAGKKVAG